jgi:O-antigen ligase
VALVGLVELISSSAYNHFFVFDLGVTAYKIDVLHVAVNPFDVRFYQEAAGHAIYRVGSVFFSPLTMSFFLLAPLAVAWHRFLAGRRPLRSGLAVLIISAALLAGQTRSALIGALIIGVLGLMRARREQLRRWLPGLAVAGLVVVVPVVLASGLGNRLERSLVGGQDLVAHLASLEAGIAVTADQPFGRGLGTSPSIGDRFKVAGRITSENAYLQVADEMGVEEMILFIGLLVAVQRRLRRRSREPGATELAGILADVALALIVGGLFLQIWQSFSLALSFWPAAGLALARSSASPQLGDPSRQPVSG